MAKMRSDDRNLVVSIIVALIGAVVLYFFFIESINASFVLKILYSLLTFLLTFIVVLGVETHYDFYYR
ncbi:hypothetical protein JW968_03330 [Candidatus Woesearchaeota archaeon]|nr:hypothetical protein [Candidatus Woesearchaeota archaeon]